MQPNLVSDMAFRQRLPHYRTAAPLPFPSDITDGRLEPLVFVPIITKKKGAEEGAERERQGTEQWHAPLG